MNLSRAFSEINSDFSQKSQNSPVDFAPPLTGVSAFGVKNWNDGQSFPTPVYSMPPLKGFPWTWIMTPAAKK